MAAKYDDTYTITANSGHTLIFVNENEYGITPGWQMDNISSNGVVNLLQNYTGSLVGIGQGSGISEDSDTWNGILVGAIEQQ